MTTSQPSSFMDEIHSGDTIPIGQLAYFRQRLQNKLHEMVFLEFIRQQRTRGLTQAKLAHRIGRKPEQITRWLGAAGNWTLDTLSDLLLGMGSEPTFAVTHLTGKQATDIDPLLAGILWIGKAVTNDPPAVLDHIFNRALEQAPVDHHCVASGTQR